MRRSINWLTVSVSSISLIAGLALSGCGGGGTDPVGGTDPPPAVSGMLRKVRNAAELETSLRAGLQTLVTSGAANGPVAAPAADASAYSNTNTVEAGVDEFDLVRFDGTHLFVATWNGSDKAVRILRTTAAGTAQQVSRIQLPAEGQILGMYVANGRLMVIGSAAFAMPFGDVWASTVVWAPTNMTLLVYDVSDAANPRQVFDAELDGVYVESRRIDDRIYLVTRHTPEAVLDPAKRASLSTLRLDELLPKVRVGNTERNAVAPTDCYVTNDATAPGYAVLTTITMLSLQNPAAFTSTCYNDSTTGVYASLDALYISQSRTPSLGSSFTRIHKFALVNSGPAYSGSVEVEGSVWTGGQRDYRMSEHEGLLRVFTSDWKTDAADRVDHHLFVLRQKAAEPALEIVGQLPSPQRPGEIGKPNEDLYGVRFVGDRAYGVTFERIDPLYVFDLSNPQDPRIAGELELPGVSEYLHPVGENLLLGLGNSASNVKLELFDVSALDHPVSRGAITLPGALSYSEATYDRHAFTYRADTTDRLAFPATTLNGTPGDYESSSSLYQFEVAGKQVPSTAVLRSAGIVTPPATTPADYFGGLSRSYLQGEIVWYVRGGEVWSTNWTDPGSVRGPF